MAAASLARSLVEEAEAGLSQERQANWRRVALEELPFELGGEAAEPGEAPVVETRHVADREAIRDRAELDAEALEGRDREGVFQGVRLVTTEALAEAALALARHFQVPWFKDIRADCEA